MTGWTARWDLVARATCRPWWCSRRCGPATLLPAAANACCHLSQFGQEHPRLGARRCRCMPVPLLDFHSFPLLARSPCLFQFTQRALPWSPVVREAIADLPRLPDPALMDDERRWGWARMHYEGSVPAAGQQLSNLAHWARTVELPRPGGHRDFKTFLEHHHRRQMKMPLGGLGGVGGCSSSGATGRMVLASMLCRQASLYQRFN